MIGAHKRAQIQIRQRRANLKIKKKSKIKKIYIKLRKLTKRKKRFEWVVIFQYVVEEVCACVCA